MWLLGGIITAAVATTSCTDHCSETYTYVQYEPQYVEFATLRSSFSVEPGKPIERSGKIYVYGNYLFVTEPDSGIHVIDNSNPSIPIHKNFIRLMGVHDVAVKGTSLYADSYMDLVVMDIADVQNIELVKRIENVFNNQYTYYTPETEAFIAGYTETDRVEMTEQDCDRQSVIRRGDVIWLDVANAETLAGAYGAGTVSGISGSMARMNIVGDYLYGIDDWQLNIFDLTDTACPEPIADVNVGWGIETLFPYEDKLFIGAADGLYIFDNARPEAPYFLSKFNHARACDPVVVQDDIAYVTLRNGTECDGFANQLDVVDIADPTQPRLLYTHAMDNPHGLGVDRDLLFICEGAYGLKVFDKSDLSKINERMVNLIPNVDAFDVIPMGDHLIMIGEDGLYQFDYSNPAKMKLLSVILTGQ